MKTLRKNKDNSVTEGTGNVFADLGLANAEDLQLKAELARQICSRLTSLGLNQTEAATLLGLKQPDVSRLVNGRHTGFSADRLIELLNILAVDVDIVLRPRNKASRRRGTIRVMHAV